MACIDGFMYTLSRSTSAGSHWVCEKRGTCKARFITQDRNVIKPTDMTDIHSSHTHAPDCSRVGMVRGLNTMKLRRQKCSENFTISALPKEISIPEKFKITLKDSNSYYLFRDW